MRDRKTFANPSLYLTEQRITMQIAISSQNRNTVTAHAGKCRNFWIYDIECGQVKDKRLVELPLEQSFHASHHQFAAPLANISVLITGSLGNGLNLRLKNQGVQAIVTAEENPDEAVRAFLEGTLVRLSVVHNNHCHEHAH